PVNASNVTGQALNGNVYITDSATGNVTLLNNTINSTGYSNTAGGTGGRAYSLTAVNAAATGIVTAAGNSLVGDKVILTSTLGGIGTGSAAISTSTNDLAANAAGDVYVTNAGSLTIEASSAGTHFSL